jgi:hypothetical protein
MFQADCYNIVVVSPADVKAERKVVIDCTVEWNAINTATSGVIFNPMGWEINAYPEIGNHPQTILNKQILEKADILIAIFWTRIGTPTREYDSGTVEEITKHINLGKPALIYFSSVPVVAESINMEQYKKLQEYKNSIKEKSFYKEFSDIGEFQRIIFKDIQMVVNEKIGYKKRSGQNMNEKANFQDDTYVQIIKSLNDIAKVLLKEGTSGGSGTIMMVHLLGGIHIQTDFNAYQIDSTNGENIAELNEAIDQLESNNLIKDNGYKRESFQITSLGYKIAKLL